MLRFRSPLATSALLLACAGGMVACSSDSHSASTTSAAATSTTSAVATSAPTAASGAPLSSDASSGDTGVATGDSSAPTGDTTTGDSGGDGTGDPYSVDTPSGTLTLDGQPQRIVSLSPTATETLFEISAGAQVVAVDAQSDRPDAVSAVKTDLSSANPDVNAIADDAPDLVIIDDDSSGIAEALSDMDIPVWIGLPATTLDDVYSEIEDIGTLTGHVDEATALATKMQNDITLALNGLPDSEVPLSYYHEIDNTFTTITSSTLQGQIYSLAGLIDIADTAEASTDHPQLDSASIVSADPQLIFLADPGESPATVAARDGWAAISAVKNNLVITLDPDTASRWGPSVVDYVHAVVTAVKAADALPAG